MNKTLIIILVIVLALVGWYLFGQSKQSPENSPTETNSMEHMENKSPATITPISHATAVINWGDVAIYTDPVSEAGSLESQPAPNIVLVTDIHGDHFDTEVLGILVNEGVALIVPQAVADELPADLAARATVLANGESLSEQGFEITAVPMYNVPESEDSFHTKGRGNGYTIEKDSFRVYVAGDTSGTPEMRALSGIDIALVPMNLPYTMDVEEAASAVLDFEPKQVYPYHYRGTDGLSDVNRFKELVDAGGKEIEVVLLNWYPNQ